MLKSKSSKLALLGATLTVAGTQAMAALPSDVTNAMGETKTDVISAGGLLLVIAAAVFGIYSIVRMLR